MCKCWSIVCRHALGQIACEGVKPLSGRTAPNLHSVWSSGQLLWIRCRSYGNQAALQPKPLNASAANITVFSSLRLVCSRNRAAGAGASTVDVSDRTRSDLHIPGDDSEAVADRYVRRRPLGEQHARPLGGDGDRLSVAMREEMDLPHDLTLPARQIREGMMVDHPVFGKSDLASSRA